MIIITTTSRLDLTQRLISTLKANNLKYHIIQHEWHGFLDKIHETAKYLRTVTDETHFIYTDAWDTIAMHGNLPQIDGLLISGEKQCYPHPDKASQYPENPSQWKYVNGGGWGGEIAAFLYFYDLHKPTDELNDQVWLTDVFLKYHTTDAIRIDYNCEVFQTVAFAATGELSNYYNEVTGSTPMFWHGNGHTDITKWVKAFANSSLTNACAIWKNDIYTHQLINEAFTDAVNETPKLKEYRDWIESNIFGFGERSFIWLWNLLSKEYPKGMDFLEIGVFRGQSLGAIKLCNPKAKVVGITPLDSSGGHWESNYAEDIKHLHNTFKLKQPQIIKGLSTDSSVKSLASRKSYDVIYIDGGHTYEDARHDVQIFSSFVKVGGYLVIDDCANSYPMPDGYFRGIEPVSRAVNELLPNDYYKEVLSVVHIRVFKRIK